MRHSGSGKLCAKSEKRGGVELIPGRKLAILTGGHVHTYCKTVAVFFEAAGLFAFAVSVPLRSPLRGHTNL